MSLEGPEGSITKAGTDPKPQGGCGDGGALGDPIRPSLSWIHRERKKQKGSDGAGEGVVVEGLGEEEGGPRHWLTNPNRKSFFILRRTHAVTGRCINA